MIREPVVAVIVNQVDALQKKELMHLHWGELQVVRNHLIIIKCYSQHIDEPVAAYCTPEKLFGTPYTGNCLGTVGQFGTLPAKKDCIGAIAIDEACKMFDRLSSYRPTFHDLKTLK